MRFGAEVLRHDDGSRELVVTVATNAKWKVPLATWMPLSDRQRELEHVADVQEAARYRMALEAIGRIVEQEGPGAQPTTLARIARDALSGHDGPPRKGIMASVAREASAQLRDLARE